MSAKISHDRQHLRVAARALVRFSGKSLTTSAVIALLFAAHQYWGTDLRAHQSQQDLLRQMSTTTSIGGSGTGGSSTGGSGTGNSGGLVTPALTEIDSPTTAGPAGPIGQIRIPRLDLDLVMLEGADRASLQRGPGHLTGTPLPGQPGNSVIAGHRTTWGAPFADLDRLRPGDRIEVMMPTGRSDYLVTTPSPNPNSHPNTGHRIIRSDDLSVVDQEPTHRRLTLITCHPRFSASNRLVVVADLIGPVMKTPIPASAPATTASGFATVDVLALTDPNPAGWAMTVPPAALALLCWLLPAYLAHGRAGRPRWRRLLRTALWRMMGAALVSFPLFVTFDRLAPLLPIGG